MTLLLVVFVFAVGVSFGMSKLKLMLDSSYVQAVSPGMTGPQRIVGRISSLSVSRISPVFHLISVAPRDKDPPHRQSHYDTA